ncbi:aspartate-semialdehyde dehydrogenase [Erysipelothrix urinaevulpis]|uniref:aspartate-semialdehyde dehydrogenase n=1 Tax=Erysipelothrix urinaevulpis TaxID=2683717 RepID=UPI0019160EC6|nr:aspartate-semialdehyde dehydrogenase [Erysipelothrix urinaevulpis]
MSINLAVVGASGLVGETILKILEERNIQYDTLVLFASKRSAGSKKVIGKEEHIILELTEEAIKNNPVDYVFFAASGDLSKQYSPVFVDSGATVIDNTSQFRMDTSVPLVVPEVNPEAVYDKCRIIANPNCSTIQSVLALKAIDDLFSLKRVIYTTYQSVSGSGYAGLNDLENKVSENYPHAIHENILPHIDSFLDNGYTKEEMKMIEETQKILGIDTLPVTATTARVPLPNTHAVSINVECERSINLKRLKEAYKQFPGIELRDNPMDNVYPLASEAQGCDDVFIGRIREDYSVENGLNLWCVADNIRKGAASNSVDILQLLLKERGI